MTGSELQEAFNMIEAAAVAGERCPQNQPHGPLPPYCTPKLARAGMVRFEIYGRNYRVATILFGMNAGKKTKPPPGKVGKPSRVGDTSGFYRPFW